MRCWVRARRPHPICTTTALTETHISWRRNGTLLANYRPSSTPSPSTHFEDFLPSLKIYFPDTLSLGGGAAKRVGEWVHAENGSEANFPALDLEHWQGHSQISGRFLESCASPPLSPFSQIISCTNDENTLFAVSFGANPLRRMNRRVPRQRAIHIREIVHSMK